MPMVRVTLVFRCKDLGLVMISDILVQVWLIILGLCGRVALIINYQVGGM